MPRPARLGHRDAPDAPRLVEVLPAGVEYLTLACASENEHRHDVAKHRVGAASYCLVQALGLLRIQIALLLVVLLHQRHPFARVYLDTRNLPPQGQVERIAHEDEEAVGRTGCSTRQAPVLVHFLDILPGDYLVAGNMPVAVDTTSPNNTNLMSTVTAGVESASTAIAADSIDGGAGNDLIVGGGGADTLTGGAGADRFAFIQSNSVLVSVATITDYRAATGNNAGASDTILLLDVATAIGTVATVQDLSSQASLGAALNAAANGNSVDNGLVVFMWGGDTYILVETDDGTGAGGNTTTFVATDFLVKLTGTPFTTSTALNTIGFDGLGG